jgi:amidase
MSMSAEENLMVRPADELARMVKKGEVTPRELVEQSLSRIEVLNDEVGAFTYIDAEGALAAADDITADDYRPFAGVPIAIKDNKAVSGMPLNFSANLMGDFRASRDTRLVEKFREAGFIIVGKTKMPEYGLLPVTDPTRGGRANNPWDLGRTPGGSSGGAAAAVAAGMVPVAHATDGGGSTRIPAACTGLVGLKPQRGRISLAPELGDSHLIADGVLTRTTRETAMILDQLEGYETGDATWAIPPSEPYAKAFEREPSTLKIGWTTEPPIDAPVDPESAKIVETTAALLADMGHRVDIAEPGWKDDMLVHLFSATFGPAACTQILFAQMLAGREATAEDMEPLSWHVYQQSMGLPAPMYMGAMAQLSAACRPLVGFFDDWDILITPALAEPPVEHGVIDPRSNDPAATFARSGQFSPFAATANVTGLPAISIPIAQRDDMDLPLAVHMMAGPNKEGLLLQVANQLEQALPWKDRLSPLAS